LNEDILRKEVVIEFAEGKHSVVIAFPQLKIVLKIFQKGLEKNAEREYHILRYLANKGLNIPKPYTLLLIDYPILIREYIRGKHFKQFLEEATLDQIRKILLELLKQCHLLDVNRVFLDELSNPTKNVIVTPSLDVYIIDFERAVKDSERSNVTQFLGYLYKLANSRTQLSRFLRSIICSDKIRMISLLYKKKRNFNLILEIFK